MGSFTEQGEDLAPQRVKELIGKGDIQLVDIREDYEHRGRADRGRPPHRHGSPGRRGRVALDEGDKPVVFYRRTGSRSAVAVQAFRASGREAYHLDGGISAWVEKGLPIEPEDGEVVPYRAGPRRACDP